MNDKEYNENFICESKSIANMYARFPNKTENAAMFHLLDIYRNSKFKKLFKISKEVKLIYQNNLVNYIQKVIIKRNMLPRDKIGQLEYFPFTETRSLHKTT